MCSQGSNYQYANIGTDNSMVLTRQQAIIYTNDGSFINTYVHLSLNELKKFLMISR